MDKVEIKLKGEDVKKLEDMKDDLSWLDSEIKRAEKVGLDVSDLKKRLIKTKKLREGILKEYK